MAEEWKALPLDKPLYANLDQDAVVGFQTAIENGYVNELGGHNRFPGLVERASVSDNGRVYLHEIDGDMIAATSKGRIYRVDRSFNVTDMTGLPVSGGRRVVFAPTDRELLMAAGGPIIRLRDKETKTELLSSTAPEATHVGWIDGYTIAVEVNSGRFSHSPPGEAGGEWDALDTFAADGNPDNINSLLVTPFREMMLGGASSVEQFERLTAGDIPFFRRWAIGDGVKLPYGVLFADNAMYTVNALREIVRFSGQTTQSVSSEIGRLLEKVDDWEDAWLGGYPDRPLHFGGQKFMVLQIPRATNPYGTKGITLLFDYKNKRFSSLYGWDPNKGVPTRWPGWSHWTIWDRVFVGGEGKIYELSDTHYRHGPDGLQRWLVRTAQIAEKTSLQVNNVRLRIKRGIGTSSTDSKIRLRCSRDGRPFGPWITRSLGKAGQRTPFVYFGAFGNGDSFMFEISTADNCAIDLIGGDALVQPIGH